MPLHANNAIQEIQENLKKIRMLMNDIEDARFKSETTIDEIEKIEEDMNETKMENFNKNSRENLLKEKNLRNIYTTAIKDAKQEEKFLREALEKIQDVRFIKDEQRREIRKSGIREPLRRGILMKMLMDSARTLPLYVGKMTNSKLPPLCGCVPAKSNYIAKEGELVAAFVQSKRIGDVWILAEIINFNPSSSVYEVEDIDEEDKVTYKVRRRNVIPLPEMRANPETDSKALFPVGAEVLAVYPQTTCFYRALVAAQPTNAQQDYELLFEDDNGQLTVNLFVPQRYVVSNATKKSRKSQSSFLANNYFNDLEFDE